MRSTESRLSTFWTSNSTTSSKRPCIFSTFSGSRKFGPRFTWWPKMSRDGSPPSSWYDPPESSHSAECNCLECHIDHHLTENYGSPDFQCCTDDVNAQIDAGEWCGVKPVEHNSVY